MRTAVRPRAPSPTCTGRQAHSASLGLIRTHRFVRNGEQWDDEDGLDPIDELPVTDPVSAGR